MNSIKEIIRGMLIGVANIIPGVSGGTMAVSMGVYDKIISAITGVRKDWKKSVLTLLPYVIGAGLGIGILSFVLQYCLTNFPLQTSGIFIGLIVGGIPVILKKMEGTKVNLLNSVIAILFFSLVVGMAFLNGNEVSATDININVASIIQLLFIGIIASATMIIPGVSGSLVMMILGFYGIIISNISNFISALLAFDIPALIHSTAVLFPFGIGVLLGIGLISKLIEILFAKAKGATYSAIMGLIIGSPIAILYKTEAATINAITIIVTVVLFSIGFAIAYILGKE